MASETLQVANVKCGGCASRIRDGLGKIPGVEQVEVDIPTGRVTLSGQYDQNKVVSELASLGYPVKA